MDPDEAPETEKKDWAFIFSPCIVIIGLLFCLIIYEYATVSRGEPWAYLTLFVLMSIPYVIGTVIIDMLIRNFLRNKERKAGYIWTIESILLVLCLIFFYYYC